MAATFGTGTLKQIFCSEISLSPSRWFPQGGWTQVGNQNFLSRSNVTCGNQIHVTVHKHLILHLSIHEIVLLPVEGVVIVVVVFVVATGGFRVVAQRALNVGRRRRWCIAGMIDSCRQGKECHQLRYDTSLNLPIHAPFQGGRSSYGVCHLSQQCLVLFRAATTGPHYSIVI